MNSTNEHYLERVLAIADSAVVEACEDILSGSGQKLLAKGSRIDSRARDRLLEHKLRKPLESSLRVVDGVTSRPIDHVAEAWLGDHDFIAQLCGPRSSRIVARALHDLRLSTPMESMLSIYAAQAPRKLQHAVGVALIAAALGVESFGSGSAEVNTLLIAGLVHDIGELYIDPGILNAAERLNPAQWRHITAHPVIAGRVLQGLSGAGPRIAQAVLQHHERLDGFGYPRALAGAELSTCGQMLGLAEALIGLCEAGTRPDERAAVMMKLMPGEFERGLRDRVSQAADLVRAANACGHRLKEQDSIDLARRALGLAAALDRLMQYRGRIGAMQPGASGDSQSFTARVFERCARLQAALASTGLNAIPSNGLPEYLSALDEVQQFEVATVLGELRWRVNELCREIHLRADLPDSNASVADRRLARALAEAFDDAVDWRKAVVKQLNPQ